MSGFELAWPRTGRGEDAGLFARTLAPLTPEVFLREYWDRQFLVQSGQSGRFAGLLPWEELNTILDEHRLEPKRLALYRDGQMLDKSRFLVTDESEPRINPAALALCLSDGATLVLNQVNELAPAVRRLVESFEAALGVQTTVNLYAGWKRQNGFDLHWDSQDTLILQLAGNKRWKVYQPTRLHPLREDNATVPEPTDPPVWDGILTDGSMLYMPRGWWHVAFPLDEPSLHLTVTIMPPNGRNLLHWAAKQVLAFPEVRKNVPRFAGPEELEQYAASIRRRVSDVLTAEAVKQFLIESESRLGRSTRVELPHAPAWTEAPLTIASEVEMAVERGFAQSGNGDGARTMSVFGKSWPCDDALGPALDRLQSAGRCEVARLCERLENDKDIPALLFLLGKLAMSGALIVRNPGAASGPTPVLSGNGAFTVPGHIAVRHVGDGILARNTETGQFYEFNGPGAIIWSRLRDGCTEDEAAIALCEEYEIDEALAAQDVQRTSMELLSLGLLQRKGMHRP